MKFTSSRYALFALPILTACGAVLAAEPSNSRYASSSAFQKDWAQSSAQTDQRLTVGRTTQPILIDGRIGEAEWRDATELSGLIDNARFDSALYQTHIRLTYDKTFLYVAMQSQVPGTARGAAQVLSPEALLRSRAIADDTNVDFDDSLGLDIVPRYPNGNLYKLYVNSIGTRYDYLFYNEGDYTVDVKWDPAWVSKSTVSDGSWNLETAIPIKAFGAAAIQDNEIWAMNVQRIWRMLRSGADRWAVGGAADKNPGLPWRMDALGHVQFVGSRGVVIRNRAVKGLLNGNFDVQLSLRNRDASTRKLVARISLSGKVIAEKRVALLPQASQQFDLAANLTQAPAGLLEITVADEAGKALYRQQMPYKPQDGLNVDVKSYPSRNLMQAAWELRLPQEELSKFSLQLSLRDAAGSRPALVRQVASLKGLKSAADFKTGALPNGRYWLNATLKKEGTAVASRQLEYVKQSLPAWYGNKLGLSQTPPPPWTPVWEKADRVGIWNREVRYDGGLFPAQIINKKQPMLARPIAVTAQLAGQKAVSSNQGKPDTKVQWLQKSPTRVTSKRVQQMGGLQVSSTSFIEFDGMTWIEMEVAPPSRGALLQRLSFDIPLNKAWAELINTYDYTLRTTGKLTPKGWSGRMRPLWLGNGDGGLQFFAETDATWRGSRQLRVLPEGNSVHLQVNLVDTPTVLHGPLKFAFGFITTPVKPAPANHRDWRVFSGFVRQHPVRDEYLKKPSARKARFTVFDLWNQGWWWLPTKYDGNPDYTGFVPVPSDSTASSYLEKAADGFDIRRCLYGRISRIGTDNPWFRQFGDEWVSDMQEAFHPVPGEDSPLNQSEVSAASSSYRDFVAWGYNQLLSRSRVPGLYFDLSDTVEDNNVYHGSGVGMGAGGAIPTQNILGQREIFKRIYTLLKQHDPQAMIFHHMSGHVLMPIDSFVDGQVDGENTYSLLDRLENRGYEKALTLDRFRVEYAGQNNLGPVGVLLDQFERRGSIAGDEWKTMRHHGDYLVGMSLLHDSTNWWSYMPLEIYADMYRALDDIGVDSSYLFVPYWNQQALKLPAGIVASFYVSPQRKKAAMVLMNTSDKEQDVDMELDGTKLGLAGQQPATKVLYPPEAAPTADWGQRVKLPAYRVRVMGVGTK